MSKEIRSSSLEKLIELRDASRDQDPADTGQVKNGPSALISAGEQRSKKRESILFL